MRFDEVEAGVIEEALPSLTARHLKLILVIYHEPGCLMTPSELKKKTGLLSVHVGNAGKQLAKLCGVDDLGSYVDGGKYHVAYFQMIGPYSDRGWTMNHNLREAVKSYLKKCE